MPGIYWIWWEKNCVIVLQISDRTQTIVAEEYQSGFMGIKKGMPQGSILEPLLFTIFIN